jgi:hypothetical protein
MARGVILDVSFFPEYLILLYSTNLDFVLVVVMPQVLDFVLFVIDQTANFIVVATC